MPGQSNLAIQFKIAKKEIMDLEIWDLFSCPVQVCVNLRGTPMETWYGDKEHPEESEAMVHHNSFICCLFCNLLVVGSRTCLLMVNQL